MMSDVDRAVTDGEDEGFVKIHVRDGTDRILGATVAASHAGEMISEISLAMSAGIGLNALARVNHPYPTQSQAIKIAADAYRPPSADRSVIGYSSNGCRTEGAIRLSRRMNHGRRWENDAVATAGSVEATPALLRMNTHR